MNVNINETVEVPTTPEEIWPVLLDARAVSGYLGVAEEVRDYQAADAAAPEMSATDSDGDGEQLRGHTFKIVGVGGGLYHAVVDEFDEPNRIAYAVWRDDTPDTVALLTFELRTEGTRTALAANFTMDMPIEDIFGLFGTVMMPVIEPMAEMYMAHRLRQHLRTLV